MDDDTSGQRTCYVCGVPLRRNNTSGLCPGKGKPACSRERARIKREGFSAPKNQAVVAAGDVNGHWTALETGTASNALIRCRCECGTERLVRCWSLITGKSRDCGCVWRTERVMRGGAPYIAAGSVFGRLTVLDTVPRCDDNARCRCECGSETEVGAVPLKHGHTRSCGCLLRERRSTLDGFSKHPLYATWNGIIDRCTQPDHPSYASYGGRGIGICERWLDPWVFAADIEREIGPRPGGVSEKGWALYSLDRIDNDRGYEPGNLRWADYKTQRENQRTIADLTRERDALAARLEAVERRLSGPRRRNVTPGAQEPLF